MNCPKCFEPLRIADRQGIEIDFCPDCRGVWLDKGELDKIIERTLASYAPPRDIPYREPDDDRRYGKPEYKKYKKYDKKYDKNYYKKKKAKHFIKEVFDIFD